MKSMTLIAITLLIVTSACWTKAAEGVPAGTEPNIVITSPRQYQVFQRQSRFDGYIRISGRITSDCDKLQVRISGKSLKGEMRAPWQTVPFVKQTRSFSSLINVVPGGWYQVEFRALKNGRIVAEASVDKIGVGEVFVGAGQSNSTCCGQEKINETTGMVSSFSGSSWQLANDPQLGTHDKMQLGSFWPAFGDAMYQKYGVPIGVAVTGHGGSKVDQWQPDAADGLFPWMMTRIYQLGPQGFRAVLWHQGESDFDTPVNAYVEKLTTVIRKSTELAEWEFPWFVANASYHNPEHASWPLVREAQQKLWKAGTALEGPDTDTLTGDNRDNGGTGVHFSPKGLRAHGQMWAEKVGLYLDKVLDTKK